MAIDIKKKDGEHVGRLMRRFSNAIQRSQLLTLAKKRKHYEKKPTKREFKEEKIRQLKIESKKHDY